MLNPPPPLESHTVILDISVLLQKKSLDREDGTRTLSAVYKPLWLCRPLRR